MIHSCRGVVASYFPVPTVVNVVAGEYARTESVENFHGIFTIYKGIFRLENGIFQNRTARIESVRNQYFIVFI